MKVVRRQRERGAALLNLALALALGMSISAGAFWVAAAGNERSEMERSVAFVKDVSSVIIETMAMKANYSTLDERVLKDQGVLPDAYWWGYNLRSPLGDVGLAPWAVGGACASNGNCDNGFRITLEEVSVAQCRYLMIQNLGSRHVLSGIRTTAGGWVYFSSSMPTSAEVEAACGTSNTGIFASYFFA